MTTAAERNKAAAAEAAAKARKKDEETAILAAGFSQTFPGVGKEGTLVPRLEIMLDPPSSSVRAAVAEPKALTIEWPITGRVKHFRDCKIAAQLTWLVRRDDGSELTHQAPEAVLVVDGGGKFEVRVKDKPPVLDVVAAGIVTSGRVGFSLAFPELVRADAVRSFEDSGGIDFKLPCKITVELDPPADLRLGDRATFTVDRKGPLQQAELELRIIERDENEIGFSGAAAALRVEPGRAKLRAWSIGFTDAGCTRFSYAEGDETGDLEYAWELWGKSAVDQQFRRLLSAPAPFIVKRPLLQEFEVVPIESSHVWQARGQIAHAPRDGLRVVLAMVDVRPEARVAGPLRWAAPMGPRRLVRLDEDGKFSVSLAPPPALADGSPPSWLAAAPLAKPGVPASLTPAAASLGAPPSVKPGAAASGNPTAASGAPPPPGPGLFGVLTLAPLARPGKPDEYDAIGGFLGFDEDRFARYQESQGPTWDESAAWICSAGWNSSATRPPMPKRAGVAKVDAPGPEAGGDQSSPLTMDEIWVDVIAWEAIKGHMYRDSSKNGHVTVGAGNKLESGDDALTLKKRFGVTFQNRATGVEATPDEIKKAYETVWKIQPPGMSADKYRIKPAIELDGPDIRKLAELRFQNEFLSGLGKRFKEFDRYPKCVRRALFDIGYNAGVGAFDTWIKPLADAVEKRNWEAAVGLVPKPGRPERRQWRQSLFAYANQIAPRVAVNP